MPFETTTLPAAREAIACKLVLAGNWYRWRRSALAAVDPNGVHVVLGGGGVRLAHFAALTVIADLGVAGTGGRSAARV